jgi:hypothetical protein
MAGAEFLNAFRIFYPAAAVVSVFISWTNCLPLVLSLLDKRAICIASKRIKLNEVMSCLIMLVNNLSCQILGGADPSWEARNMWSCYLSAIIGQVSVVASTLWNAVIILDLLLLICKRHPILSALFFCLLT